ncbi:MAG TPA: helix-turn-helix domain-containing protein [Acidimicrobiales bacterium]|nr:helix-turn-helix domain-containing protein [Acidimicrobiales bacterium]
MSSTESLWKNHLERLGEFIKAQRQVNQLSQRQLAKLSDLSDTYMSQLERGLHEPSLRVLRAIAENLGVKPSQLIMYAAGLPVDSDASAPPVRTEDAIRRDSRFTDAQKKALLGVVRSYLEDNDRNVS